MSRKKATKSNAMRILDAAGVDHQIHVFEADGTMTGVEIAQMLGEEPEHVFKTLVTIGKSKEHYVFMVPVAEELDLKKAAKAAGEKSIEMVKSRELFDLTGYVHGGCSPLGMKKFFTTFIDETCILFDTILFSGGRIGTQIEMSFDNLASVIDITPVDLVV